MAFIVTDFNEYKSYGNCLNEHFILCPLRHWRQNSRVQGEDLNRMSNTPTNIVNSSTTIANRTSGSSVSMTPVATSARGSGNDSDDGISKVSS